MYDFATSHWTLAVKSFVVRVGGKVTALVIPSPSRIVLQSDVVSKVYYPRA